MSDPKTDFKFENQVVPGRLALLLEEEGEHTAIGISSLPTQEGETEPRIRIYRLDEIPGRESKPDDERQMKETTLVNVPFLLFAQLILEAQQDNVLPWVRLDQYK